MELYNSSGTNTFDLSGWQLPGLGYTFPAGSLMEPGSLLVLAANRAAFAEAYGAAIPVFDTFGGVLDGTGETLSLINTNGEAGQSVFHIHVHVLPRSMPDPVGQSQPDALGPCRFCLGGKYFTQLPGQSPW